MSLNVEIEKKTPKNLYDMITFTHKSYPSTVFLAMSLK